jgi:hypothetical protein
VNICSPASGSTDGAPIHLVSASSRGGVPVTATNVYVDGVRKYWTANGVVDTFLTLTGGSHTVVIRSWDSSGSSSDATEVFGVN